MFRHALLSCDNLHHSTHYPLHATDVYHLHQCTDQALLLSNIGTEEIAIRDLVERGYYQGSNVSYNIKKLTDMGYLEQERSQHDRRSVTVRLTPKALEVVDRVRALEDVNADKIEASGIKAGDLDAATETLRGIEQLWAQHIRYGG